jgi:hypothetical protein
MKLGKARAYGKLTDEDLDFIIEYLEMDIEAEAGGYVEYQCSEESVKFAEQLLLKIKEIKNND